MLVKMSEGTWTDPYFVETFGQVRTAGMAFGGPYHVLWPAQPGQAAWVWRRIHDLCPWLINPPAGFAPVLMGDFELFQEFDPFRAPTLAECHQFLDEFKALSGWNASQLWAYMPEWLYGSSVISQLRYPWVSSKYGSNPCANYMTVYASGGGDNSSRWTPNTFALQYGSCNDIDGLTACDMNAARMTVANMQAFLLEGDDVGTVDSLTPAALDQIVKAVLAGGITSSTGLTQTLATRIANIDVGVNLKLDDTFRGVLNEGAGAGTHSWAETSKGTLSGVQTLFNRVGAVDAHVSDVLAQSQANGAGINDIKSALANITVDITDADIAAISQSIISGLGPDLAVQLVQAIAARLGVSVTLSAP